MTDKLRIIEGMRVLVFSPEGPRLGSERGANAYLSAAWEAQARMVALPVARLTDDFFKLRTGVAGGIVQKFANYKMKLAVVGDVSRFTAASEPLRDFIDEANRGQQLCFVRDLKELEQRLSRVAA